jgi:hypothetical protein
MYYMTLSMFAILDSGVNFGLHCPPYCKALKNRVEFAIFLVLIVGGRLHSLALLGSYVIVSLYLLGCITGQCNFTALIGSIKNLLS